MIGIINYGVGNVSSIINMLSYLDIDAQMVSNPMELVNYDKYILPGVGAFDTGMKQLNLNGFVEPLEIEIIKKKKPILGICLGMQMFARRSEEGSLPGLGWISADVVKFSAENFSTETSLKIPHMGWSVLKLENKSSLHRNCDGSQKFYFVHSYHMVCDNPLEIAATAQHGITTTASVEKENIFGCQFHPEKSHRFGMQLFRNFAEM